jgi:hypothetical protein
LNKVRGLSFEEEPQYDELINMFKELLTKAEFENDGKFDWHYEQGERPKDTYMEQLSRRKRQPLG